jgi:hypothetical protein
MERRKIIRKLEAGNTLVYYESIKPNVFGENGDWERIGRRYDIKGIDNLLKGGNFEFILDPEVQTDLEEHRRRAEIKKRVYQK